MEKLREIYENAEKTVCEVVELDSSRFLTSHEDIYVDARCILIDWLIRAGFTERMICRYSGMSQQRVNLLKNNFMRKRQQMHIGLLIGEMNRRMCLQEPVLQETYKPFTNNIQGTYK